MNVFPGGNVQKFVSRPPRGLGPWGRSRWKRLDETYRTVPALSGSIFTPATPFWDLENFSRNDFLRTSGRVPPHPFLVSHTTTVQFGIRPPFLPRCPGRRIVFGLASGSYPSSQNHTVWYMPYAPSTMPRTAHRLRPRFWELPKLPEPYSLVYALRLLPRCPGRRIVSGLVPGGEPILRAG